jgi:hypothetical protein
MGLYRGFIYKIYSDSCKEVYIGSTKQKYLSSRWASHNHKYKEHLANRYNYVSSFEIIKHGDAKIILLETCYFNDRKELFQREGYYQRELPEVCNKVIAGGNKIKVKVNELS